MKRNLIQTPLVGAMLALSSANAAVIQWPAANDGNDHWYEAIPLSQALSWSEANSAAQTRGGHLVDITSAEENLFVFSLIDSPDYWNNVEGELTFTDGPWIGAHQEDLSDEPTGNFIWSSDGSAVSFANWHPGEPNNLNGSEDYVKFFKFGSLERAPLWNDAPGFVPSAYIIEYDSNPDADSDGIRNTEDPCPNSNTETTVMIDGCDSGVPNVFLSSGCTISDQIAQCAASAANHDEFVSCIAHLTNALRKNGDISNRQKSAIQSCAAKSSLP